MFPRRRGRGEGPLACLMTKHFDLKFAASMKLVKARAWRLPVVPPGTSPIDRQPAAINPRHGYHGLSRAGPKVRIHLPPADSLGLAQTRSLQVEKPAVPRGCAWAEVGRDTKYCRKCATRRCYLCRAIFQYRSVADVVRGIPGSFPRRSCRWAQIKQNRAASAARARLAADVSGRAACLP
jgi:hypothetical protein